MNEFFSAKDAFPMAYPNGIESRLRPARWCFVYHILNFHSEILRVNSANQYQNDLKTEFI